MRYENFRIVTNGKKFKIEVEDSKNVWLSIAFHGQHADHEFLSEWTAKRYIRKRYGTYANILEHEWRPL